MPVRSKNKSVLPSKVSSAKRYEYLKKIEIDGYPRIRAYAEAIDPTIYDMPPAEVSHRLDYLKKAWDDYDDLRAMVLAERADWMLRRSAAAQEKAMELLNVTLDRAIAIAKDPEGDAKTFQAAVATLKTIMPALTKPAESKPAETSVKNNAARFIK